MPRRLGNFSENLPPTTKPLAGITSTPAATRSCNAADTPGAKNSACGYFFVCDPVTHLPIAGNRS